MTGDRRDDPLVIAHAAAEPVRAQLGPLLRRAIGADRPSGVGPGPFTHTYTPDYDDAPMRRGRFSGARAQRVADRILIGVLFVVALVAAFGVLAAIGGVW